MILDPIDFFIRSFFFGGLLTTSIYCFIAFLSRGREKSSLGYTLFSLAAASLFFFRRLLPLFPGAVDSSLVDSLSLVAIQGVVASGTFVFLYFLNIRRGTQAFRFFLTGISVLTLALFGTLVLHFVIRETWPTYVYYSFVGLFTLCGLLYIFWGVLTRRRAFPRERRMLVYLIVLLLYLAALAGITVLTGGGNYYFVIISFYTLLIAFFYVQGAKMNSDYRELSALKDNLEKKVADRTARIEELHRNKQQFFINFTHDTKTPLTLISSYLERYIRRAPPHPDLEIIQRNLETLRRDMADYLDFEKFSSDQELFDHDRETDCSWLLREKIILFQPLAEKKRITLTERVQAAVNVAVDPAAAGKIISNLLDNALKYTEPGGRVEASIVKKGGTVRLSVRDTGIGISREAQEHIFEPFYQAGHKKSGAQGVGMGLAIVRRIVDDLGGEISIRSGTEKQPLKINGRTWITEITVTVGRRRSRPAGRTGEVFAVPRPVDTTAAPAGVPDPVHDPAKATVLVVEDNADFLLLLTASLGEKYNAYGALSGGDALGKLETIPKPDLVVSDIMMEGMDGYAFFHELKKQPRFEDVPVIFLTAVSSPLERLKSLSEGVVDFITKPLSSVAELEAKIESLLELLRRKTEGVRREVLDKVIQAVGDERRDLNRQSERLQDRMAAFKLTDREQRIVALLREGLQNKEISARLEIATRTIDNHLYNIYRKTGCQSRMELLNKLLAAEVEPE
jgi:signal transduction histidine kinase/DNA-binding NarL/FixJ family response regulator